MRRGVPSSGRVLVVDDDPAVCALVQDMLSGEGWDVVCAQTDQQAYAAIPILPLVALIVDVNLRAGTTGFDVARYARQVIPALPVLYVSGEARSGSFRAFGVPDSGFLSKPFTSDELLAALDSAVNASGA